MTEDLIKLPSIAADNATDYIKSKFKDETMKLTSVFITEKEEENCSLQKKLRTKSILLSTS